jgi:ABC-type glutathione transport system ATPase component
VTRRKIDRDLLLKIIRNPEVQFKIHAAEHLRLAELPAPRGRHQEQAGLGARLLLRRRPRQGGQLMNTPANTGAPLLAVDGVSLEYRTPERIVRATHRVSFDVFAGDRYVLLGASGCGKSSLLKSVAGFVPPREGEIRLAGKKVDQPGPDRIVVFQEFDQLPPWKTVRENVMFPLLASKRRSVKQGSLRTRQPLPGQGRPRRFCRRPSAPSCRAA